MKTLILAAFIFLSVGTATAQNAGRSASQNVQLGLTDVVSTGGFSGGGSGGNGGGSGPVTFPLSGTGAMSQGVESPEIQVTMQSNAVYDVNVSSSTTDFTYTGGATFPVPMNVKDVLSFSITGNSTGGSVGNNFSQFQPIDGTNQKVAIVSGQPGVSTFSFKYKAQPGFSYPAGTYTTNIVFTIVKK